MGKNKEKYALVEMSHILNAVKGSYETLREQQLFYIYLSRINARDPDTVMVRLTLKEFCQICKLDYNVREPKTYKRIAKSLMQNIVELPLPRGGVEMFPLFGASKFIQDDNGEWFFELHANWCYRNLFFDLKRYVNFKLDYVLQLKSLNQMRLYTLLKQYDYIGNHTFELAELRELLGITAEEHKEYRSFRQQVIEVCRKEINALTDIEFDYVGVRGRGRGGRIIAVEFTIRKNPNVKDKEADIIEVAPPADCLSAPLMGESRTDGSVSDPLMSDRQSEYRPQNQPPKLYFDGRNKKIVLVGEPYDYQNDDNDCYAAACEYIFSECEIGDLIGIVQEYTPCLSQYDDYESILATAISREYKLFLSEVASRQRTEKQVNHYYKFFRKMLENKLEKYNKQSLEKLNDAMREYENV